MERQDFAFSFIHKDYPEWAVLAWDFEKLLFTDMEASLVKARKLAEAILKESYNKEQIEYNQYSSFAEKLMFFKNDGVIDEDIFKSFDRIRRMGNLAAHEHKKIPFSDGLKVHTNLYKILKWYLESYSRYDFLVPEYQDPKPENLDEKVRKLIGEYIPTFLKDNVPEKENSSTVNTVVNPEIKTEQDFKTNGSFLLYQLSKLRESSLDAVEGYKGLSTFKKYMHIKRPIEEKLENIILEGSNATSSRLVLLCGSVGDGKSHLLSQMNTTIPEAMNKFKIHNDATESFDPRKNSLDTLAEVLEEFSDEKIGLRNHKLILAINLGVLNNFLESSYSENYKHLKQYVLNANVFASNAITKPENHNIFRMVNFSDYKLFELSQSGPVSSYITSLFERITKNDIENPFFVAYEKDKMVADVNPLLINYQMFSSPSVQKQIIQLIIKTISKDKVLISSRALLNFIFDILVPSSMDEIRTSDFVDMLPSLLPNLLFEGIEKSQFLRLMANQDPIHKRIKEVDEKLISLNNSGNYYTFFRDVIYDQTAQEWLEHLNNIEQPVLLDKDTRRELSELFIRASYLYESHLLTSFKDKVYKDYMKYLFAYNTDKKQLLQNLYYEIEKAIYLWKGSPKSDFLFIDEESSILRIAEALQLRKAPVTITNEQTEVIERFTPTLFLGFKCGVDPTVHRVEIDLPLYQMVIKVLNGYRLNKKDREDSIQFIDFIEKLLPYGRQHEEILIKDVEHNNTFLLKYDPDFEVYTFSKEL